MFMLIQCYLSEDHDHKRLVSKKLERPSSGIEGQRSAIDQRLQALSDRVQLNEQQDLEEQYPDRGVEMKDLVIGGHTYENNYRFLSAMLGEAFGEWAQGEKMSRDKAPKTFQVLHLLVKAGKNVNSDASLSMKMGDTLTIDLAGLMTVKKMDGTTRYQINLAK